MNKKAESGVGEIIEWIKQSYGKKQQYEHWKHRNMKLGMIKGKRAQTLEISSYWILRIFFLVIVVITFFLFVRAYIISTTDVQDIESAIFLNRLIYSRNGISYFDIASNRVYPGIIDPLRMDWSLLNKSIYYGENNPYIAASITLRDINDGDVKNVIYNPEKYDLYLQQSILTGTGATKKNVYRKTVLYKDKGELKRGYLVSIILVPNG